MNTKTGNPLRSDRPLNSDQHLFIDDVSAGSASLPTPLPEILFITSYSPRECGIATYSSDLVNAINNKFENSFNLKICPVESDSEKHCYENTSGYILNTDHPAHFAALAQKINTNPNIGLVLIQHEFGFFSKQKGHFLEFVNALAKPLILVFHTVLPKPDKALLQHVRQLSEAAESVVVMTQSSRSLLMEDYGIPPEVISVIPHGTHLVVHTDKEVLKDKYQLSGKKVLSTFGLLSSGKSIETTLDALPEIIKSNEKVLFLIIGKTHPGILKQEGENYRNTLLKKVETLRLHKHVLFINQFLTLPVLLEYLQLTDIYLFTSKDPNQAVSGTFSYAISCGCPVVTTPIPYALEALRNNAGVSIDFSNHIHLAAEVIKLLNDEPLRKQISSNGLHYMASSAWENSALAHLRLFKKISSLKIKEHYKLPPIQLSHIKRLTTSFGMIQFCKLNQPDTESGYTLDDNSRALVALCQHFELTADKSDLPYLKIYLDFIDYCLNEDGSFKNYVSVEGYFTSQNETVNLADAKGRALWALGYVLCIWASLPKEMIMKAERLIKVAIGGIDNIHSTRAMAFVIKGLYYANARLKSGDFSKLITTLADRLVQMYRHESTPRWQWFENYVTYGNSVLPEALLCAWQESGVSHYRQIATTTFNFLLSKTIAGKSLRLISNKGWMHKGEENLRCTKGGEQPIDAAYTVMALDRFYNVTKNTSYLHKMTVAFEWFLGNNQLNQIIYNPCTGGCYDGLEESSVNLNQGAESTLSYLMARLTMEKHRKRLAPVKISSQDIACSGLKMAPFIFEE